MAFGGLGTDTCKKLDTCSFEDAFNLALGIGIQNFPEGLAVSMPLRRSGASPLLPSLLSPRLTPLCQARDCLSPSFWASSAEWSSPRPAYWALPLCKCVFVPDRAALGQAERQTPGACVDLMAAMCGQAMEPVLPYAMSFAAGAMIFVVVDDLIPEAQEHGNGRSASLGCMAGFIVMMSLDVALG